MDRHAAPTCYTSIPTQTDTSVSVCYSSIPIQIDFHRANGWHVQNAREVCLGMVTTTLSKPKLLSPLLRSTPTSSLKCSLPQKAAASIWMALGKGWRNGEGGKKPRVYCTACRQDKARWNNLRSELLGACPAALHLLTLTRSPRQISARRAEPGDDGEESGIRGNLPSFGQLVRKSSAGAAGCICGASCCNGSVLAKPLL